jgi:type VI secretion system protein ImpM
VTQSGPNAPTEPVAAIPGWYGKLPSLGDFASRRLPSDFITPWDAWLQAVLPATQDALGPGWLDAYLTTPIWRFVLLPGLVGPSGWAGVLMPSVDRVGRYFPLTVTVELPSHAVAHAVFKGADWFAGLEDAALGMLDSARGPDDLDEALAALPLPLPAPQDTDESDDPLRPLQSIEAFESVATGHALAAWAELKGWRALWWTRGRVDGPPLMFRCAGLPTAEEFRKLLESRQPSAAAILSS